jgi:hypothetical protein
MAKALTLETLRQEIKQDIKQSVQQGVDDVLMVVRELAQFTSDGFGQLDRRIDKLDSRVDSLEKHAESVDITLRDHTARFIEIQSTIDGIASEQISHSNDIKEIFVILDKFQKNHKISIADQKDAEIRLNRVIAWAKDASIALNIPIKL